MKRVLLFASLAVLAGCKEEKIGSHPKKSLIHECEMRYYESAKYTQEARDSITSTGRIDWYSRNRAIGAWLTHCLGAKSFKRDLASFAGSTPEEYKAAVKKDSRCAEDFSRQECWVKVADD